IAVQRSLRFVWLLVALLAELPLLIPAPSAAAAADLIAADPAPGSTLNGSPSAIRLDFSQPLSRGSHVDIYAGEFQAVAGVNSLVAGWELRAVLPQPLPPATYTVQWQAITDDGASAQGSYQFAVAASGTDLGGRLGVWAAIAATIVTGVVTMAVFVLNRRKR